MGDEDLDFWDEDAEWDLGADAEPPARHRHKGWVRLTAAVVAGALVAGSVGASAWLLAGVWSRPDCSQSAADSADLLGRQINDAASVLAAGENRCGDTLVAVRVEGVVACDRDRPGTIVARGALTYELDGDPVVPVTVCAAAV